MTETTDRIYEGLLVLRCQAGDEAAFAELVERFQPRLRYYLRKMLRDLQGAEDALQDVWLDVFRAVPRLSDAGALRAWLYRIAHDRALRVLRKQRVPHQPLGEVDPIDERAEEAHFRVEDVERIHAALDDVSLEHREVLVFRFVEAMTYEELAQVLSCQVGTVRSRLHYAKRALRSALERMNT